MSDLGERRMLLAVFYDGPWARLARRLWAINSKTNELRREVKEGGLRCRLALWADDRDQAWLTRHAVAGSYPRDRWSRRNIEAAGE